MTEARQRVGSTNLGHPPGDVELSVIVSPVSDGRSISGCLDALRAQQNPPTMKVIVPVDESIENVESLRQTYCEVDFLEVSDTAELACSNDLGLAHEAIDRRRAAALHSANTPIVALTDAQARPASNWCANIVEAHRRTTHAVIGGAIENSRDRLVNWALYFCDAGRYQNPLPEGPARYVSDVNVSYKRLVLDEVADVWRQTYNEVAVHDAIRAQGEMLWLRRDLVVYQDRGLLPLKYALKERLAWARLYAGRRSQRVPKSKRVVLAATSPLLGGLLLWRQARLALQRGRHKGAFLRAFPLLLLIDLLWGVGEFIGYTSGRAAGSH